MAVPSSKSQSGHWPGIAEYERKPVQHIPHTGLELEIGSRSSPVSGVVAMAPAREKH